MAYKKTSSNILKTYRKIYRKNLSAIIYRIPISLKKLRFIDYRYRQELSGKYRLFMGVALVQKGLSRPSLSTSSACGYGGLFFTNVLHQSRSDVAGSYFVKQNMHVQSGNLVGLVNRGRKQLSLSLGKARSFGLEGAFSCRFSGNRS